MTRRDSKSLGQRPEDLRGDLGSPVEAAFEGIQNPLEALRLLAEAAAENRDEVISSGIILVLKRSGLTEQEAMDRIGEMVEDCYQRWHEALNDLPPCDDDQTRSDVLRYVEGCQNIVLGICTGGMFLYKGMRSTWF